MGEQRYDFDGFRLDVQQRRLHGADGSPLALTAKAFDTLLCLIRQRDRIVPKDELLAQVWPGRVIEENNLAQAVSSLRRALDGGAGGERYIVTVSGRGYRFVADVVENSAPAGTRREGQREVERDYLAALDLIHAPSPARLRRAIGAFRQVLDRDPGFARAWSGLAFVWRALTIVGDMDPMQAFPLARAAVTHALALEPDLADAHVARGFNLFWHDWDWHGAEAALQHAIKLDPALADARFVYAHLLNNLGRFDEALVQARQARELDPQSPLINTLEAGFLGAAGRYEESSARIARALELAPDFWLSHLARAGMTLARGEHAVAIADLQRAAVLSEGNSLVLATLAMAQVASGDRASAEQLLKDLEARAAAGYVPATSLASIRNVLGDTAGALDLLERAYAERDIRMAFLGIDSRWNNLRGEPRFQALARSLGLEQARADGRL